MSKFKVTVTYSLETTIEPEGVEQRIVSQIEDADGGVESTTARTWTRTRSRLGGGEVEVVLEADSEEAAEDAVREQWADGSEVEDYNGVTWQATDVEYQVEREEMDEDEAKRVVRALLQRLSDAGSLSEVESEAIAIVRELS
jgi:hypothetical protein